MAILLQMPMAKDRSRIDFSSPDIRVTLYNINLIEQSSFRSNA